MGDKVLEDLKAHGFPDPIQAAERSVEAQRLRLRDWFAGMALQGFCAAYSCRMESDSQYYADKSYEFADAMLNKRADP